MSRRGWFDRRCLPKFEFNLLLAVFVHHSILLHAAFDGGVCTVDGRHCLSVKTFHFFFRTRMWWNYHCQWVSIDGVYEESDGHGPHIHVPSSCHSFNYKHRLLSPTILWGESQRTVGNLSVIWPWFLHPSTTGWRPRSGIVSEGLFPNGVPDSPIVMMMWLALIWTMLTMPKFPALSYLIRRGKEEKRLDWCWRMSSPASFATIIFIIFFLSNTFMIKCLASFPLYPSICAGLFCLSHFLLLMQRCQKW